MTHMSTYPIPPYSFEANDKLVEMLEFDQGGDELLKEIEHRKATGEWMTWPEQKAIVMRVNPAYAASTPRGYARYNDGTLYCNHE